MKYSSQFQKFLIGNKYAGVLGRRIYSTYTVKVDGKTSMTLHPKGLDEEIVREVFQRRPYEKYFKPEKDQTVIDIGAHIGSFTIRSSALVGSEGQVIAFEPSSENYSLLVKNVVLNNLENVRTHKLGLGESEYSTQLYLTRHAYGNTTYRSISEWDKIIGQEEVQIKPLDAVVEELQLEKVDFVKIDAEGAELSILKGAKKSLQKFHPKIVGEAHPAISDSGDRIADFLDGLGYDCVLEPELEWNPVFHAS